MFMNKFQERLNELLQDNNLNRLQLAKKLNISSTTINGYFNKNYYPETGIAIKMATYFNCSLDYLLGLTDDINIIKSNKNSFIENFDFLLKNNKLKVRSTMKQLNMSEYDYYRWKKGQIPKMINLIEIAKYFDVSVDFLLGNNLK